MDSKGLALEVLMFTACSRSLDSLASTTLSLNQPATEDEDEADAGEDVTVMSRDSDDEDRIAEPKLPQTPPDLRQVVVQKLEGTWAGQGANYGDLYVIESHGATLHCLRKGLSGRKFCTLSWDASKNQMVLGGRYTLDPAVLLAGQEQIVWRRVEAAGKKCKEVTWKRFEQAHNKTPVPCSETQELLQSCKAEKSGHDVLGNDGSQQIYSRSMMLSFHCRLAPRTHAIENGTENKLISLKSTSEIQFVCPSIAPTCKSATHMNNNASKKFRQLTSMPLDAPSLQGGSDLCAQLAANSTERVLTWLTKAPAPKKKAKTNSRDVVETNLDLPSQDLPSEDGRPANKLAAKLAKLLLRTPVGPSKVLRDDAPEFVPAAASELRAEAPEFVPCFVPEECGGLEDCTSDVQFEADVNEHSKNSSLEVSSASDTSDVQLKADVNQYSSEDSSLEVPSASG
eukprot:TRINITY_DN58620_c0_g1_i1.p1 TRINITY_DN58620_c0_g1~~TRINITY_DN58620_c0_g1_i1.p1  ORF type:complete len:491 (-),score=96.11 TRINITY_DN58620_c0_g1_i1:288-1649(-)